MRGIFLLIFVDTKSMYSQEYYQKHREQIRANNQRWRDKRIEQGLCTQCNNPLSPKSKCFCESCLEKNNEKHKRPSSISGKIPYPYYCTIEEHNKLKKYLEELRTSRK